MIDFYNECDIEVIGGSSYNKILLWEESNTNPISFITSQEFVYTSWAVGVGNLDGLSNGKEILAGVFRDRFDLLYYDNVENSLIYKNEVVPGLYVITDGIIVTNVNNVCPLEIIVAANDGLRVFNNEYYLQRFCEIGSMSTVICQ